MQRPSTASSSLATSSSNAMRWVVAVAMLLIVATAADAKLRVDIKKYRPSLPNPIQDVLGYPTTLAALGRYYVVGVPWCSASSLMVATVILRRELKRSEAYAIVASCVVPIIGGMVVNHLFAKHPELDVITPEQKAAVSRDRFGIGSQS